ncbi:MAG: type VI secretion system baseplate subunit TssG [Candidatus Symbiothrix sp.]|jgi:hypothetical protein|nr:type VI secretion system baseplate subunit TssG [Candidatus Symbiothrix sp.]
MSKKNKNIFQLEDISKSINSIDSDFRSEVFAAGLIEKGYDSDLIQIVRQGGSRRNFSKDIESVDIHFSEYDFENYLQIKINKESIYDILPEGIFHQSIHKRFNKDKEDIIDEIKQHRLEELYARKFFQLFEIEVDSALILAYLYEIRYDKKISNSNYTDIFVVYWHVLKLLKPEQRVLFMHTIPFLHQIRNNCGEIEKTMSILLEVPIHIEDIKLPAKNADSFFESALSDSRLGIDLVLGKMFDDGQYDLKVTVGPISAKKMEYFLETSVGNTILDFLCCLFFPGDVFVVKDFKVFPEDAAFVLSNDEFVTFLGINAFI